MKKEKFLSLALASAMILSLAGCGGQGPTETKKPDSTGTETPEVTAAFTPGTYTATVDSVAGPMTVSVTVTEDRIEDVTVVENNDTDGLRDVPVERIPKAIVESQSINVDSVTGATLTSIFLKDAVKECLLQATDDLSAFQTAVPYAAPAQSDMDVDLVIVGGGIAGMSSAAVAAANGLKVVLVERQGFLGGNAIVSDQFVMGMESAWTGLPEEYNGYGVGLALKPYVSPNYSGFVMVDMPNNGGCSTTHALMKDLKATAEKNGALLLTDTTAIGLVVSDGTVTGITAQPKGQDTFQIDAKAVLLASGGFWRNPELVKKYLPFAAGSRYGGASGGYGDAIGWVEALDGKLVNMEGPQVDFYSVSPTTGYMSEFATTRAIRFLNAEGDLLHEDSTYNSGTLAAFQLVGTDTYYAITSRTDIMEGDATEETMAAYEHMVLGRSVVACEGMDAVVALGLTNAKKTLTDLGYSEDDTFYVGASTAGIYGTYGGLGTDGATRVLNNNDEHIPGLYAAGEAAYGTIKLGVGFISGHTAVNSILEDLSK